MGLASLCMCCICYEPSIPTLHYATHAAAASPPCLVSSACFGSPPSVSHRGQPNPPTLDELKRRRRAMPQEPAPHHLALAASVAVLLLSSPLLHRSHMAADHHSQHHDHQGDGGGGMQMVFEYGSRTTVWFNGLQTASAASYVAVLGGLFVMAVLHEGLAALRSASVVRAAAAGAAAQEAEAMHAYMGLKR